MPDGVLPGGKFFAIVREPVSDEIADAAQCQPLVRRLQDGHRDECDVRVGRLDDAFAGLFRRVVVLAVVYVVHSFLLHHLRAVHDLLVVRVAKVFGGVDR